MKTSVTLTILTLSVAAAFGQPVRSSSTLAHGPQQGFVVRGEVSSKDPRVGSLTVQLAPNGGATGETAEVSPDGSFEFPHAMTGPYELSVVGTNGAILYDEPIFIRSSAEYLSIRLAPLPKAAPSGQGTISIRQLQHNVPAKAQQAFNKGKRAALKGDSQDAMAQFRTALSIDPEFADAYSELGTVQASLGNLTEAAGQFQKAVDLVPDHQLALPNLCIVLASLKRYA